jgi:hypothetical protein
MFFLKWVDIYLQTYQTNLESKKALLDLLHDCLCLQRLNTSDEPIAVLIVGHIRHGLISSQFAYRDRDLQGAISEFMVLLPSFGNLETVESVEVQDRPSPSLRSVRDDSLSRALTASFGISTSLSLNWTAKAEIVTLSDAILKCKKLEREKTLETTFEGFTKDDLKARYKYLYSFIFRYICTSDIASNLQFSQAVATFMQTFK